MLSPVSNALFSLSLAVALATMAILSWFEYRAILITLPFFVGTLGYLAAMIVNYKIYRIMKFRQEYARVFGPMV